MAATFDLPIFIHLKLSKIFLNREFAIFFLQVILDDGVGVDIPQSQAFCIIINLFYSFIQVLKLHPSFCFLTFIEISKSIVFLHDP